VQGQNGEAVAGDRGYVRKAMGGAWPPTGVGGR
jgi:hypothetical protein